MCTKTLQSPLIRGSERFGDKSANNYWLWQLCRQSWAGFTLTFVPHRYCRKQARIWYRKLLVGQLNRETVRKSINEKKIDIGFGTEYYRISGGVTARRPVPSSSPWHKQAGCLCSPCGRKHCSLERKEGVNTVSLMVVVVGHVRVCGKVGVRKSDWFS